MTQRQLIHGLRGSLHVTFEEGTSAAWLYTLLKPHAFADRCRHERRVAEDSSAAIRRVWAIPCGGQGVHPRDIFGDRHSCAPFTRRAIVPNGSGKSPKPVSAGGRNSITSNLTRWCTYTDKPRKSCWPKAGSTRPRSCFARFLPSARFGRFCWLHFSKHRIGSAPRGNYGPTVNLQWSSVGDTQQRGISLSGRAAQALKESLRHSWAEQKP